MLLELDNLKAEFTRENLAIVDLMATRLKNKTEVKRTMKCYHKTCVYVRQLYEGTFLHKNHISQKFSKDYPLETVPEAIMAARGDWTKVRALIVRSLDNLKLSKHGEYYPRNKTYIEGITFSNFFETNYDSEGMVCQFYHSVCTPYQNSEVYYAAVLERGAIALRKMGFDKTADYALAYAVRRYENLKDRKQYMEAVVAMSEWLTGMREAFPNLYSELKDSLKDGNLLIDFTDWLEISLQRKQGDNFIVSPIFFGLKLYDGYKLTGYFESYCHNRLYRIAPTAMRELPKNISLYYNRDTWLLHVRQPKESPEETENINVDWNVMLYAELKPGEGRYDTLMNFIESYAVTMTESDIEDLYQWAKQPGCPAKDQIAMKVLEVKAHGQ